MYKVHHSRLLRFTGDDLLYWESQAEQQWGASVIESIFDELKKRDNVSWNIAQLTFMASLRILKMADMGQMLSATDEQTKAELYFKPVSEPSDQERADLAKCGTDNIVTAYNAGLISQCTALREMKQQSSRTGTWTNITDEEIMNASDEIEPQGKMGGFPGMGGEEDGAGGPDLPHAGRGGEVGDKNHPRLPESRRRHQRRRTTASLFTIPPAMTWMRTGTITIHRTAALPRRELAVAMYL